MKKGLVIVHDPHNLFQFVWYYCNRGKNQVWDALCLPNGNKGEYMHLYCERAEIFENIFRDDLYFSDLNVIKKTKLFLSMMFHFFVGRRTQMCKKILGKFVSVDQYDTIVVISDTGIVTGACVALGKEKEVIILEDGINDYSNRPKYLSKGQLTSFFSWQGFILSKMGYSSPGWFRLKTDQNCIKYSSMPEKMQYKGYKEIRRLFEKENTDSRLFDLIIRKLYPEINNIEFESADAVIFTHPINDYVKSSEKYNKRLEEYVALNFQSVIIKRHPRDNEKYIFDGIVRQELDSTIPAEAILPYLKKETKVIFGSMTAIMIYMSAYDLDTIVIDYSGLREESSKSNSDFLYHSKETLMDYCDRFLEGKYTFVEL